MISRILGFVRDILIAAILGAYAFSSFGVLDRGVVYQLLNLTGAIGVGWVCWRKRTWQAFWLEAVWGGVAAVSLIAMAFGA